MDIKKPLELGGMRTLQQIVDDLSRQLYDRMMIPEPTTKILAEIEELTMTRNKYTRRLAEVEMRKENMKRDW